MTRRLVEYSSALVNHLRRPRVFEIQKRMSKRQFQTRNDLEHLGERKVRSLLIHANKNVPYYQAIFKKLELDPTSIDFLNKWDQIPILNKELLRSNFDELKSISKHIQNSKLNASGGSTGIPVEFLSDLMLYDVMDANLNLVFSWAGWKPGEMCLFFWGGMEKSTRLKGLAYYKVLLSGRLIISVYNYNEEIIGEWWKIFKQYRPTLIYGYPSIINIFAEWIESYGKKIKGVKAIFTTAEMLLAKQREKIEKIFQCKVYNQYGCREAPGIACECPEGNMHIFIDINRVEFADNSEAQDGNRSILVSPLHNYAQPLIRYDLGDMGRPKEGMCRCGRGYPLMELDLGRNRDHLMTRDGRKIYPGFFTRLMDGIAWISSFQFRQNKLDLIELDIEIEDSANIEYLVASLTKELSAKIKNMMGQTTELRINVLDSIKRTHAGKFRYVINELETE